MMGQHPSVKPESHPSGGAPAERSSTIMVPLDGSAQAVEALPVAQGLAKLFAATIHVVHIAPRRIPNEEICDTLKLTQAQLSSVIFNQPTGSPASAIVHEAKQWKSRLIVMCPHTGEEKPVGGFGSIAQEILPNTPCPIILVPPGRGQRPWSLRHVLLPHDSTPTSAIAISPVADFARHARAGVTVLHVASVATAPVEEPGTFPAPRYMDQPHHEWPAWEREFLDRARAMGKPSPEFTLHTVFCTEGIGEAIVRFASQHEPDLIALAWRLNLEPQRALTMRSIIRHAPCPVMIYPVRGMNA
ncbi:MAG TPA: universal stress protein [Nitrospiraceae bacterium]|nr:universal stress protein [Nitrospiraceae bacterium]